MNAERAVRSRAKAQLYHAGTMSRGRSKQTPDSVSWGELAAACMNDRSPKSPERSWTTSHTFFCDETGNTGSQFYSPEQPVYAEGGWIVPHERRAALEATFLEIEQKFRFTPKTKGTKLKDSTRGQECIVAALNAMSVDAIPFFYLVEKRYFICAKAVETYFDPKYNPSVDPLETFDPRIRMRRADLLYGVPDEVVAEFAHAYRHEEPDGIVISGRRWADALARNNEQGLAMQLRVCLPRIRDHMRNEFTKLRGMGLPKSYDTLNAPSLAQTFQLIERSSPPCDLIHDQCDTMAEIYRFFFDRYRNAAHEVVPKLDGGIEIFGFRQLNSLSFANSEELPLLRACDYLLAACVDFTRRAGSGQDIPDLLRAAAHHGLGRMMDAAAGRVSNHRATARQIGEFMASDAWIEKVVAKWDLARP